MKAEDTVEYTLDEILDQRERAFELGKQAGIKEVVEWISEHVTNQSINPTIFPRTAWQQKCTEWGI